MKKAFTILFLSVIFISNAHSQSTNAAGGPIVGQLQGQNEWTGSFNGDINGTSSVLSLNSSGNTLTGDINAGGYIYQLNGQLSGNNSSGTLTDKVTGGQIPFAASVNGSNVTITLKVQNEYGQQVDLPIQFQRSGSQNTASQSTPSASSNATVQRDPNLIGGWRHTESYTSGEFGMVSEWYLTIKPDGNYIYGDGKVAGGGDGYSFDSGEGGSSSTGQWKTENGVVFINEGYGWQQYAGYYIEGNSMMFKFADGSKQLWERYR